ncbi:MAG: hypothetical protein C0504_15460 [Candidatus Solibacter sp.]|nr:hypothetical protein [Candidatus Solibacter sp.]
MKTKLLAAALAAFIMPAWADFSYDQVSTMTGGSMLRMMKMIPGGGKAAQPQTSRILLKGNKLATLAQDSISVIDLDAETMTSIDLKDKKYSVITFAEFRQAMKAMADKMSGQKGADAAEGAQMEFDVKVDPTGQTRTIEGLAARQFIMTLTTKIKDQSSGQTMNMDMVSDMWLAPRIAGYEQVQQFYSRMAEKMGWAPGMMNNPMMMGQRGYSEGMAKMIKEASKLEGVPVFQITTMQGPGGMPGGEMPQMPNVGEAASDSARRSAENSATSQISRATGRLGGLAGGALGGFGRRKKQEAEPAPTPEQPPAQAQPQKPAALMEVTVESRNFSTSAIDGAQFAVPAGFKQVEHDMKKALK